MRPLKSHLRFENPKRPTIEASLLPLQPGSKGVTFDGGDASENTCIFAGSVQIYGAMDEELILP